MKKRYLILLVILSALLVLTLAGCGQNDSDLDGKNIVTFYMNDGTLDFQTSSSSTKVHFAYYPGTYILDPTEIPGYQIFRSGYDFTGWYTSKDCNPGEEWDFEGRTFDEPALELYAGWKPSIKHTYTICYIDDEGNTVSLGEYEVEAGESFVKDSRNFAKNRKGYTPLSFYSDASLTTPWDTSFAHPGGDSDCNINVYVEYVEGDWSVVSTFNQLVAAINGNKNAYITNDIDCGGAEFPFASYKGEMNGNGHTVSNFKVAKQGTLKVSCFIFKTLDAGAKISNITFDNVQYILTGVSQAAIDNTLKVAALAGKATDATIKNVSITGTLTTNYTGELPRLNEVVYDADESNVTIENFTSSITVTTT